MVLLILENFVTHPWFFTKINAWITTRPIHMRNTWGEDQLYMTSRHWAEEEIALPFFGVRSITHVVVDCEMRIIAIKNII